MQIAVNSQLPETEPAALPHSIPLPSYWQNHFRLPTFPEPASLASCTDIAIIGTGMTGVLTAYYLVKSHNHRLPLEITLFDAREFCSGATARNGGHLSPSPIFEFDSIATTHGLENAISAVALEDRATKNVIDLIVKHGWEEDVDLVRGGNVHLFSTQAEIDHIETQLRSAKNAGTDISRLVWIDAATALSKYGAVTLAALEIPGNNFYPLKFVAKVYQEILRLVKVAPLLTNGEPSISVTLHTHCAVEHVVSGEGRRKWELRTKRGNMLASDVVHCTNGYVSHLLPQLARGPSRVVPTRGQVIAYQPSSRSRSNKPITKQAESNPNWTTAFSANEGFEYFFQRPSSSLVDDSPPISPFELTNREGDSEGFSSFPLISHLPSSTPPISSGIAQKSSQKPGAVILGGGRSHASFPYEFGITDDSILNPIVSKFLHGFLAVNFPSIFGHSLISSRGEAISAWDRGLGNRIVGRDEIVAEEQQLSREAERIGVVEEWSGIMGFTLTHAPFVGRVYDNGVEVKGHYLSAGYSGHGMSRIAACAEALAMLITADLRDDRFGCRIITFRGREVWNVVQCSVVMYAVRRESDCEGRERVQML